MGDRSWYCQILTGKDNATLAFGRVIGLAVAVIFLWFLPVAACAAIIWKIVPSSEWEAVFDKLSIYVPAVCLAIAGLIGLTHHAEPGASDGT